MKTLNLLKNLSLHNSLSSYINQIVVSSGNFAFFIKSRVMTKSYTGNLVNLTNNITNNVKANNVKANNFVYSPLVFTVNSNYDYTDAYQLANQAYSSEFLNTELVFLANSIDINNSDSIDSVNQDVNHSMVTSLVNAFNTIINYKNFNSFNVPSYF